MFGGREALFADDLNGDGLDDIVVWVAGTGSAGVLYVFPSAEQ